MALLKLLQVTLITGFLSLITPSYAYFTHGNHAGLNIEIDALYAKSTDTLLTNSIYAVKIPDPATLGDFKEEYHRSPEYSWGGFLSLGYDFPTCCAPCNYGVSVDYTFFHNNDTNFLRNDTRNSAGLPVIASAEFIDLTDEASAKFSDVSTKFRQRYDTVDLLANKKFRLCHVSNLKFFSGLRYFRLKEQLNSNYFFLGDIEGVTVKNIYDVNFENEVNAIGPHLGTQMSYCVMNGLSITGQLAGSLLYGNSKSQFHNTYSLNPASTLGTVTALSSTNHHGESAHFIPALSGKVGISYQTKLCNCSSVAFELGYRGDRYFNAADDVAYQQLLAGDDINSSCNYQDFDLSGPYFSITLRT